MGVTSHCLDITEHKNDSQIECFQVGRLKKKELPKNKKFTIKVVWFNLEA